MENFTTLTTVVGCVIFWPNKLEFLSLSLLSNGARTDNYFHSVERSQVGDNIGCDLVGVGLGFLLIAFYLFCQILKNETLSFWRNFEKWSLSGCVFNFLIISQIYSYFMEEFKREEIWTAQAIRKLWKEVLEKKRNKDFLNKKNLKNCHLLPLLKTMPYYTFMCDVQFRVIRWSVCDTLEIRRTFKILKLRNYLRRLYDSRRLIYKLP